ncbi:MAG: hypothetical protein IKN55_08205 [Oscillospiraceae bacterium]|nr:hypothetical protein [Oscillospiraceae bacterium]
MIRKMTVCGGDAPWLQPALSALSGYQVVYAEPGTVPDDSDCVLIVQEFAGDKLADRIRALHRLLIPLAVVTYDGTTENQEFLAGCGADDVIVFPIAGKLLRNRLELLCGSPVYSPDDLDFSAFDRIRESNQGKEPFIVPKHDFENVYRFVIRLLERLDQKAQFIIFTFTSDCGPVVESQCIMNFTRIVQACLRRGDISAVYGRQVFIILMGADDIGGHMVIGRVMDAFTAHFDDENCEITFDMREISSQNT